MGKWIFKKKARHDDWSLFMCSECGRIIDATVRDFYLHAFDFCPRCGAKMQSQINTAENTDEIQSEELKQKLLGMDSNLTIIDESYGERRE